MSISPERAACVESPPIAEPLPLVAFERYMLADDRPEYPMLPVTELVFDGRFDPSAFAAAVDEALARNTLLRSLVTRAHGKPCWLHMPDAQPLIEWSDGQADMSERGNQPIDLSREIGIRLFLREHAGQTSLLVQHHHACADGDGVAQFVEDLFYNYAMLVDPHVGTLKLRTLDQQRLRARGDFTPAAVATSHGWRETWQTTLDNVRFAATRPATLAAPQSQAASGTPRLNPLHLYTHRLTSDETEGIRAAATRYGVQTNDYVLACLFAALAQWHSLHGGDLRKVLRMLMPVNLRTRPDMRLPAANRSGFAFVTRRRADLACREALLKGLSAETQNVRRQRVGQDFLGGVGSLLAVPGLLPAFLRLSGCAATAVFSYIGDPARRLFRQLPRDERRVVVGNVTMDQVYFAPPVRPLTRAAFGMTTYAGRIHLGLKCDPWLFSADDCRDLLNQVLASLRP